MGSVSQQDFMARLAGRLVNEYPTDQRDQMNERYRFVERLFGENGDAFIYRRSGFHQGKTALVQPSP
ncbi:uncharacterized protein PV06_03335 [Exophiala oligosperma]|uniref:Uncharacterized protein n=1 Tax=Exophiala oligosperma TaxID=215243 RepID=A0A0D2DPZ0_9EURO|nr:uncharacterized protein PV06_03335 [Exophiala oligosperma]KIW44898.1 hypothetical protein PV06_03335 [Exophiala oligosperma]